MIFWIIGLLTLQSIQCVTTDHNNSINHVLAQCCTAGEDLAEDGELCSNLKSPIIELIPAELISSCFFASEICCSSKIRINQCKAGVLAGKDGSDCHQNGTEFYTSCCEACKIGLVAGASDEECSLDPFAFGPPFDDSYKYCCMEQKAEGVFYINEGEEKDLCSRFDRLCDQICENNMDSYVCKCYPGFQLLEDKKTCVKNSDEVTDNEVLSSNTEECSPGFARNPDNEQCEDIDECESSDVECNIDTQVCYNTPGSYKCLDILQKTPQCTDGFRHNMKTDQCDDINECMEETDNCTSDTQICMNTRGGFTCQDKISEKCMPGFQFDVNSKSCQDINECETEKPCQSELECVNTPGGFDCIQKRTPKKSTPLFAPPVRKITCAIGFKLYFDKCIDIDECSTNKNACDSNQICINLPGGFQCDCKIGFTLDKVTNACVDINECQINNHDCLESQRCDNTIGSYTCIRLQSCGTGYTLNAGTGNCDDDDECALGRHNCISPYECRNTKGSFRCDRPRITTTTPLPTTTPTTPTTKPTPIYRQYTSYRYPVYLTTPQSRNVEYDRYLGPCNVGFERNAQGACADIDECRMGNPCRRNERCLNTNGSYKCQMLLSCSAGYTSNDDGTQCIDIDECETKEANCGPDQICRNKPGGYICSCPSGHILNNARRCEDVNECEFYKGQVCPINTECFNTIGSYRCDCLNGFKKRNDDDKVCMDVDECNEIQGLCAQRCINFWGSYRCACESGYRLSDNNRTCDDIDECEVHKSYNLCMGICDNTPGSYQCLCPEGYKLGGDGRTCQDIDECETSPVCKNYNEICTNVRGSYRCTQVICPSDYKIDPEKKNRCIRLSLLCERDDIECFRKPSSYTYNFITLVSNAAIPPQGRALFNLKGPSYYENIDFDLRIINYRNHKQRITDRFFSLHKMHNEVLLSLMESIEGPQDIDLELSMTVFRDGQPSGSNVAKIFIIVSEFPY